MRRIVPALSFLLASGLAVSAATVNSYVQTNLTSDLPGIAAHQDPDLMNPWGIVAGPKTPFWINDNGTGLSTLYNGAGTKIPLVVTVPTGAPTGIVFNGTGAFGGSHFIFDSENGTISAWSSGTAAALQVTSAPGSVYKGLAIGSVGSTQMLYASNFGLGQVDVFDSSFHSISTSQSFRDPNLPAGYAPFNIQNLNRELYVTYAEQNGAHHDDVAGAGHGFVDVYDMSGNFVRRAISQGALNSPWGLALAPSQFGAFSGDLLVGNFGDGDINAFNPATDAFMGTLDNAAGKPTNIDGLWGLRFGNGAVGQNMDTLYFTAGIAGPDTVESHGLFGALDVTTPEPKSALLLGGGLGLLACLLLRRRLKTSVRLPL